MNAYSCAWHSVAFLLFGLLTGCSEAKVKDICWEGEENATARIHAQSALNDIPRNTRIIQLLDEGEVEKAKHSLALNQFWELQHLRSITNRLPPHMVEEAKVVLESNYTDYVALVGRETIPRMLPSLRNDAVKFLEDMAAAGFPTNEANRVGSK